MKQIATVTQVLGGSLAQVSVVRRSACAHDCENCSGCGAKATSVTVCARCEIPVAPGDMVELYSDNRVLGYAALVYLVPLILFIIGYICPANVSEAVRYLCAFAGLLLGIAIAVACDRRVRRSRAVMYEIVRKI